MHILKDIIIQDLFLYLPKYKTFIISDVHIGYEESLHRRGVLIPKHTYEDLLLRLEKALETIKKNYIIDTVVVNGDIIHEFGKISNKERVLVKKFMDFLLIYGKVILIEGNHDNALKYFINSNNKTVSIQNKMLFKDILVIHGDIKPSKELLKNIKTIIIGHEHPAINLKSFSRTEKFKCFLKGSYDGKTLIVMPSCNLLIEGTNILQEKLLSPYLIGNNLSNFEAYLVGDEIYDFGKLKNLF